MYVVLQECEREKGGGERRGDIEGEKQIDRQRQTNRQSGRGEKISMRIHVFLNSFR